MTEGMNERQWLIEARREARVLLELHDWISIEDVLDVCPRPSNVRHSAVNEVFEGDEFVQIALNRWALRSPNKMYKYKLGMEL